MQNKFSLEIKLKIFKGDLQKYCRLFTTKYVYLFCKYRGRRGAAAQHLLLGIVNYFHIFAMVTKKKDKARR